MRVIVAIPVFNEEGTLAEVLGRTRPYASDMLVIDDGSTDRTWEALLAFPDVSIIRHRRNLGYGRSLIEAFQWGVEEGYDCIVTLDADNQHEPECIPAFVAETAEADVVSGTRYPEGFENVSDVPADRLAINEEITGIINRRTGYRLTDAFCGFKAYRAEGLAKVELEEPGYGMCLEFWMKAAAAGLTVKELGVRRIYNDPERTFGGHLDDAEARLGYYVSVVDRYGARVGESGRGACCGCRGGCSDAE